MAATFAFLGMLLISLVVALLAALQLGDFFGIGDEFAFVLAGIAVFVAASLALFALAYRLVTRARALNGIAMLLALLVVVLVFVPGLVQWIAARSTNPYAVGVENTYISLELLIAGLAAVLVQWGLVRRRWLRTADEDDLTRWPWVTTAVAGLAILNPFGLTIITLTMKHSPSELLWQLWASIAAGAAAVLFVMAWIECYIRGRILRRRQAASLPLPETQGPGAAAGSG